MLTPAQRRAERRLVERCRARCERAWERLIRGYGPGLLRFIASRLGPRWRGGSLAEDIAQEVWDSLVDPDMRRLEAFDPDRAEGGLAAYLNALAVQVIQRHFRTLKYRGEHECPLKDAARVFDPGFDPQQAGFLLAELEGGLTPALDEVLRHDLAWPEEPDAVLGISPAAVRQRRCRLRARGEEVLGVPRRRPRPR
jgi:DNA-directed RNA polymerase specialized sigma24 family protein